MTENRKKLAIRLLILFVLNIILVLILTAPSSALESSDKDIMLLARLIAAEGEGESYAGQVAIGAVALNRVRHPAFPDTLPGVIYQAGQFPKSGKLKNGIPDTAKRAAEDALSGWDPSGGALRFYREGEAGIDDQNRPILVQIGRLVFCS